MPRWDCKCQNCEVMREYSFKNTAAADEARCPDCNGKLVRLPAKGSFVVTGYSAKNGYSK